MAEQRIEVDEVGEQQTALIQCHRSLQRTIEYGVVAVRTHLASGAVMAEEITDLTDRDYLTTRIARSMQQCGWRRHDAIVVTIGGAGETSCHIAQERARDHSTDAQWIHQLARDGARPIETLEPEMLFMCGDLKHAVARRVTNGLARAQMLFP